MNASLNARALEEQIRSLYGEVDWKRARGILHVMAITMGPAAPRSATDLFLDAPTRLRVEEPSGVWRFDRSRIPVSDEASD